MGSQTEAATGPDLAAGVSFAALAEGTPLAGHVGADAVILVRLGDAVFATGASCTHYGGPLALGLVEGETVRCPLHHACFSLRTGEAVGAPALNPIACYDVQRAGDTVRVGAPVAPAKRTLDARAAAAAPASVVIVGAGAAGAAAAETLRREGYEGPVTLLGAEPPGPIDRPNLSKDYLAGTAPEEWMPLRPPEHYGELGVELVVDDEARALDVAARRVTLASGRALTYGALLLATGAAPIRLPIDGADRPDVYVLRTLADSRAVIAAATAGGSGGGRRAVVIGGSFIGLEVAASLRARGVEVAVVAPEAVPLARVLGEPVGSFVRGLHEAGGVAFHLGRKPVAIRAAGVALDDGAVLPADLVVMGVGVRPRVALAESAGLRLENGVVVDAQLRATEGIWAAGDVARYPDPRSGRAVRIEHWVVAMRQGQAAARNILGAARPFADVPFFWSVHYDVTIRYVGHAEAWDQLQVTGDLAARDATIAYRQGGRVMAVATIGRDRTCLLAARAMEHGDDAALEAAVRAH